MQLTQLNAKEDGKEFLEKCIQLFAKQMEENEDGQMIEIASEAIGMVPNL